MAEQANNPTPSAPRPAAPQQQQPQAPAPSREVPQQRLPVDGSHFRNGRITRHGIQQAIKNGGSVIHNGKHISRLDDIPSEADLAETPEEKATARQRLEQERERINRELDSLGEQPKAAAKK